VLSRPVAWAVVIVAMLTMTVSYVDRTTLAVLAPTVTKALDISETSYGWLTSAFSIAYLLATPVSGWWIDRMGARRGLVYSVVVWSSVAAMHAVVPGFGMLFGLRIALGIAEGPGFPGGAQTVYRMLPPGDRSRGFGVLFMGSSIGAMLAPPLATLLFRQAHSWRVAFLGTAIVGLAWIPLWIALTSRRDVRAQFDPPPEPTHTTRPQFFDLVTHPTVIRGLCGVFAAAPVLGFISAWGSKYLVRTFHTDQGDVGGYLWLPPLGLDLGAVLFGDLAARWRRAPGAPPRMLYAIAMVLASVIAYLPYIDTPWQAMAVMTVASAGGGGLYALCTSDLLSRMAPHSVAFAGGILAGAQSLALIIANPLIGAAVDSQHDYRMVALVIGGWAFPGSLIWIAWRPDERLDRKV
jgi:MFS transporter, ACS family, hexuronate transporter